MQADLGAVDALPALVDEPSRRLRPSWARGGLLVEAPVRLAGMIGTLLVSSFVVFTSLYVGGRDPMTMLTRGRVTDAAAVAQLRRQYGFDEPFVVRYGHWLWGALHLDFGQSVLYPDTSVNGVVSGPAGVTALLVLLAATMIIVAGVASGTVAALKAGVVDQTILATTTVALAIPSFVFAVVLIAVFGVSLGWFPVTGVGEGLGDRLYHLTMPAAAIALPAIAYMSRVTRAAVLEEAHREHVQTARVRGLPWGRVLRHHILRNATVPITTVGGLVVTFLVSATVVVEQAFGLQGLGSLLVQSAQQGDIPVVQAICLIFVVVTILASTLVDFLHTVIDPRLRAGRAI